VPTIVTEHYRPRVGQEVRSHVRSDVDPSARHLDPAIQREIARRQAGGERLADLRTFFGIRNMDRTYYAAEAGRNLLGIPHPNRRTRRAAVRANGGTTTTTASGTIGTMRHVRRFGVEIEAVGIGVSGAVAALDRAGVPVEAEGWRAHSARDYDRADRVRVTTDASVYGGHEAVLPPVRGDEGLVLLRSTMTALRNGGARVSGSCGMHVHVDANDLGSDGLLRLLDIWANAQTAVYSVVPRGRRSSQWCPALSARDFANARQRIAAGEVVRGGRVLFDRYRGLNLDAYRTYGTVEFRIHGGTLNATKASMWVALVTALVEAAHRGVTVPAGDIGTVTAALVSADLLGEGQAEWLIRRAAALG
jgi:hypothetical protein